MNTISGINASGSVQQIVTEEEHEGGVNVKTNRATEADNENQQASGGDLRMK